MLIMPIRRPRRRLCLGIEFHLSLATSHCDIDEAPSVEHPLPGTALRQLLLLLWLHLGGLGLHFSGTGEGAVNFTHDCGFLSGGV